MSDNGYIRWMLSAFLVTCLSAAALNLAVDPYGLFGTPRVTGLGAIKPASSDRVRFVKGYYADRADARTIIGGNSRPEMGLDPSSPCWDPADRPVFNAGVPGAGLLQQIQFIEHAEQTGEPRRVLLGLDLIDFFVSARARPDTAPPMHTTPAGGPNLRTYPDGQPDSGYQWRRVKDWLTGMFSLETLTDSITTILQQGTPDLANRRANGFNPARDYWPIIHNEGQAVLFDQKTAEVVRMFSNPRLAVFQGGLPWSWKLDALGHFLDRAKARGIEVTLFVNPYHADYLAAIMITGRWGLLADWKRGLVDVAADHGVTLWDFNAISDRTAEPPPPPGDLKTSLAWFWEPAHYRSEYGELMLASMLGRECVPDGMPAVGETLTPGNIEPHLAAQRDDVETYIIENADVRRRLRQPRH